MLGLSSIDPHPPMRRIPTAALPGCALLVLFACGEPEPRPTAEERRLAAQELTLDDVERFAEARTRLARLARDSVVARVLRPLATRADPYSSMEAAIEALEGHSEVRSALAEAGLSAEDYVRTRFALQQALLAHDIRRAGGEDAPIPAAIPEANVELVAEHRDRIEDLLTRTSTSPTDTSPSDTT